MTAPRQDVDRGSRIQLLAIVLVTLLVMVLGVLVVAAPERMGVPQPAATPVTVPAPGDSQRRE
jgi:predicted cobalt transporter CbtA